jgi:hypothetical protein
VSILLLGRCGLQRLAAQLREQTGAAVTVAAWTQTALVERLQPTLIYVDLFDVDRVGPLVACAVAGRPLPAPALGPMRAVVAALSGKPVVYRGLRRPSAGALGLLGQHARLKNALDALASVVDGERVLDVAGLWARAGIPMDDVAFGMGHGEPGEGGVAAEAAWLAALHHQTPIKCVVVDLDDTLIDGQIVSADFHARNPAWLPAGEAATQGPLAAWWRMKRGLHEALRVCQRRGTVLALATRNDPAVVARRFRKRPPVPSEDAGMWGADYDALPEAIRGDALAQHPLMVDALALGPADFVVIEAGHGAKSAMCRRIAAHLGIGLDALAFVDDSPFERAEVATNTPEVMVLDEPGTWRRTLLHGPGFVRMDHTAVPRAASYQSRDAIQAACDIDDFLRGLQIRAHVRPAIPADRPRIRELYARVHQLDLTGARPPLDTLEGVFIGAVVDRIADHGVVMAAVSRGGRLEAFVCSCRVLPHRVAPTLLWAVLQRAPGTAERIALPRNGATVGLIEEAQNGPPSWVRLRT